MVHKMLGTRIACLDAAEACTAVQPHACCQLQGVLRAGTRPQDEGFPPSSSPSPHRTRPRCQPHWGPYGRYSSSSSSSSSSPSPYRTGPRIGSMVTSGK